ncbi:hypothetical protein K502DRAFT_366601 [Neoconidiobolus thromboides FSU 785]|nr:hypothetical protein K502DRAFT_366601 [Neoconidiobolus thromboides FSU 785]
MSSIQSLLDKIKEKEDEKLNNWKKRIEKNKEICESKKTNYSRYQALLKLVNTELNKKEIQNKEVFYNNISKTISLNNQSSLSLNSIELDFIKYGEVKELTELIELNLKDNVIKLTKYYFGKSSNEELLRNKNNEEWLKKGFELPKLIKNKTRDELKQKEEEYFDSIKLLLILIKENIEIIIELIVNYKVKGINNYSKSHSNYLLSFLTSILLKFQLVKYQILLSVYNDDQINSLKEYQTKLIENYNLTKVKINQYQKELNGYKSLGNEFHHLVTVYSDILAKIETISNDIKRLKQE